MKIRSMTATFGALEQQRLELSEGLNVIYAPNEGGKSTWCAFLRAMLYGIDSAQREKQGVKPDKVRYAPWSGAPMAGEMEIEYKGEPITLRRATAAANAPMKDFSAVYTGTAQSVEGLRGTDVGETLTGLSREVFDRSVFVRQTGLAVNSTAELERRIAAIVTTGEESVASSEAEAALRAWQRRRRYRQSGAIPALEQELALLEGSLEQMHEAAAARHELTQQLELQRQAQRELEEQVRDEQRRSREERIVWLEESRRQAGECSQRQAGLQERLLAADMALEQSPFAGKTPEQAADDAAADVRELNTLRRSLPKKLFAVAALVLAIAVAAAGVIWYRPLLFVSAGCFLCTAILCAVSLKKSKSLNFYENHLRRKYGCCDEGGILALAEQYRTSWELKDALSLQAEDAKAACTAAQETVRRAEDALLTDDGHETRTRRLLRQCESEGLQLRQQLATLRGRFSALGDPLVLESRKRELTARLQRLNEQYEALDLAISTLHEADTELQQRFSPALGACASGYMAKLTNGRYDRLLFDRDLSALARRSGDLLDREPGYLSAGTLDQLYLALRLAICHLALPEGKSCPLILDDALVNFDDERMAAALELLKDIAKERQVILFTCHKREGKYLKQAP